MNKRGFSFVEVLISITILVFMTMGMLNFSSSIFSASDKHNQQIEKINEIRFSAEEIDNEISKSVYIYPANVSISLNGSDFSDSISTNSAIAMFIPSDETVNPPEYRVTIFYLKTKSSTKADLYEFHTNEDIQWTKNTTPSSNLLSFTGTKSKIASNINYSQSTLSYILNYDNGVTDSILKGEVAGYSSNNTNALIRGISWNLSMTKNGVESSFNIKGIARNVPRFIE